MLILNHFKIMKNLKVARRKENGGQISKNEILETSRKCSKDEEKCGTSAGQNSECEISGEGGTTAEKNSGYEISGWNVGGEEFQMQDIRMECRRGEFRMRDIRMECRRRKIPDVRYPGRMSAGRIPDARHPDGMSYATRGKGSSACPREREPRGNF